MVEPQAPNIPSLDEVLKMMENDSGERRNPEQYYFSIFGTPSDTETWGYRVEGHHLSQNYTVVNGKVLDVTWCVPDDHARPEALRVPWSIPGGALHAAAPVWGNCQAGDYFGVSFDSATMLRYLRRDRPDKVKRWQWGCIPSDEVGRPAGPLRVAGRQGPVRRATVALREQGGRA